MVRGARAERRADLPAFRDLTREVLPLIPQCRQVSAAFRPCASYHSMILCLCFASFDGSTARIFPWCLVMSSQKFLIPARTQVYGIYLNEITASKGCST